MPHHAYLGLGSSLGNRRQHLRRALSALSARGVVIDAVSPVVETPALIPEQACSDWNVPYLNIVIRCHGEAHNADQWHAVTKAVQAELGGVPASRWAPRGIDIDVLLLADDQNNAVGKPACASELGRPFVISPLVHLNPELRALGGNGPTVLEISLECRLVPLFMASLNITPDSFSDGGAALTRAAQQERIQALVDGGAHIIDVGAESVRPGAEPVSSQCQWQRLETTLRFLLDYIKDDPLAPRVSVDTRDPLVADKALSLGVDMINDVNGLSDPDMQALARDSDVDWVVMHSLAIPPTPEQMLPADGDAVDAVANWLQLRREAWASAGINLANIIVDPGICFGKSRAQSQDLMRRVARLRRLGHRVLMGHSRKGFIRYMESLAPNQRDLETLSASLFMIQQGVHILRVHDVASHQRAWLAWAHIDGLGMRRAEAI